jgi:hypothetical protein
MSGMTFGAFPGGNQVVGTGQFSGSAAPATPMNAAAREFDAVTRRQPPVGAAPSQQQFSRPDFRGGFSAIGSGAPQAGGGIGGGGGYILGSSVGPPSGYGAGLAPASGLGGGLYPSLVSLYR